MERVMTGSDIEHTVKQDKTNGTSPATAAMCGWLYTVLVVRKIINEFFLSKAPETDNRPRKVPKSVDKNCHPKQAFHWQTYSIHQQ